MNQLLMPIIHGVRHSRRRKRRPSLEQKRCGGVLRKDGHLTCGGEEEISVTGGGENGGGGDGVELAATRADVGWHNESGRGRECRCTGGGWWTTRLEGRAGDAKRCHRYGRQKTTKMDGIFPRRRCDGDGWFDAWACGDNSPSRRDASDSRHCGNARGLEI